MEEKIFLQERLRDKLNKEEQIYNSLKELKRCLVLFNLLKSNIPWNNLIKNFNITNYAFITITS
jgi:hypothetical protein